jgi:phosphoglycolate phosphatase
MTDHRIILFDLDGTITDPHNEIISAARYALKNFGITPDDPETLAHVSRKPLLQCFEESFGLTREQADQAFAHYWHYAGSLGVKENTLYAGMDDLLAALAEQGRTLCIATARKTRNAEQILRAVGQIDHFECIMGVDEEAGRRTKKMVIFDLLCQIGEYADHEVIMIGDRAIDIQGAHDNGIDSIGVNWGQETPEEVAAAEPTWQADTIAELSDILLSPGDPT